MIQGIALIHNFQLKLYEICQADRIGTRIQQDLTDEHRFFIKYLLEPRHYQAR